MSKTIVRFQNGETITIEPQPGGETVLVNGFKLPLSQKSPNDFVNWMIPIWENTLRSRVDTITDEDDV